MNRHLLHILQPRDRDGIDIAARFETARVADHAIERIHLSLVLLVVEVTIGVPGNVLRERHGIAVIHGQVFDLLEVDGGTNHVRGRLNQRRLLRVHDHFLSHRTHRQLHIHIRHDRSVNRHRAKDSILKSILRDGESIRSRIQSHEVVDTTIQCLRSADIVGVVVLERQLCVWDNPAARVFHDQRQHPLVALCPGSVRGYCHSDQEYDPLQHSVTFVAGHPSLL